MSSSRLLRREVLIMTEPGMPRHVIFSLLFQTVFPWKFSGYMNALSRREEEALLKVTKAQALKECDPIVKGGNECSIGT
jgi:hypothetical protein